MRAPVAAVFVGCIIALLLVAGCTDILTKQKVGGFGDVSRTTGTSGNSGGTSGSASTSGCPDTLAWDGSWDTREVGYASNHDVRYAGVWTDADPVPVTLTQKCREVTGTYMAGACPGTLTGTIEKDVFSGEWTLKCANTAYGTSGTFSVTMAVDGQSFMGAMYSVNGYGPDRGYAPSWWGKKLKGNGSGEVSRVTGTGRTSGAATVPWSTHTTTPLTKVTTGSVGKGTTETTATASQGSCGAGLTLCRVFSTDYCVDLNTDPKHCGKCRSACYLRDAENGCSGGKCYVKSCNVGFANCNGNDADGCEIDLDTDSKNCGSCGRVCSLPHSNAICAGEDGDGRCEVEWCERGWNNSNGVQDDGCEYYNT